MKTPPILVEGMTADQLLALPEGDLEAQVDGGGEGILPWLWVVADRVAQRRRLSQVEWVVHAINCAQPNLKLRRVLERRGFAVEEVPGIGVAYHYLQQVSAP